jgi:hypothetical protein
MLQSVWPINGNEGGRPMLSFTSIQTDVFQEPMLTGLIMAQTRHKRLSGPSECFQSVLLLQAAIWRGTMEIDPRVVLRRLLIPAPERGESTLVCLSLNCLTHYTVQVWSSEIVM